MRLFLPWLMVTEVKSLFHHSVTRGGPRPVLSWSSLREISSQLSERKRSEESCCLTASFSHTPRCTLGTVDSPELIARFTAVVSKASRTTAFVASFDSCKTFKTEKRLFAYLLKHAAGWSDKHTRTA